MKFDLVQSHVLGMNILPSLQEAFAYVQNADRRHSAMLPPTSTDRSAILSAPSRDKAGLPLLLILPGRIVCSVITVAGRGIPVRLLEASWDSIKAPRRPL